MGEIIEIICNYFLILFQFNLWETLIPLVYSLHYLKVLLINIIRIQLCILIDKRYSRGVVR